MILDFWEDQHSLALLRLSNSKTYLIDISILSLIFVEASPSQLVAFDHFVLVHRVPSVDMASAL